MFLPVEVQAVVALPVLVEAADLLVVVLVVVRFI